MGFKTLVFGASLKPQRFSHLAIKSLVKHGVEVAAIGVREGEVAGIKIITGTPLLNDIHTISLYMNPDRQKEFLDYFISLKPKRIIFNPGTENPEFYQLLKLNNIEVSIGCTLVMLSMRQY